MMSPPPDRDATALPVSVKAVCFDRAGRVLLCRNRRDEWELPGGRPEACEAFETCLIREVLEETGLDVSMCQMISEFVLESPAEPLGHNRRLRLHAQRRQHAGAKRRA
jgi:8-oxo-dGTP pyrophosphatase MutT (NUDIX family)